ncbi:MAG: tRNA adenosine(34) deaminase TadA [Eubacteriales bacterium]|nr:tRNA adenosine(34) deaminase TadA [Eubacteriales bacterium]
MSPILTSRHFMKQALAEANKARAEGEIPIGAVIVHNGEIIAAAHNMRETENDATSHAEIIAIREAGKKIGSWRLSECDIYVTLEPCPMCAGALIQSRIRTLYYGASDPKAGATGSVINLLSVKDFNHKVDVIAGILEDECASLLTEFFRNLRNNHSNTSAEIE